METVSFMLWPFYEGNGCFSPETSTMSLSDRNADSYREFIREPSMSNEAAVKEVRSQAEFLKRQVVWTVSLADALPLAFANWSNRCVVIHASPLPEPIEALPEGRYRDKLKKKSPILLALTATENYQDHFDVVVKPKQPQSQVPEDQGEISFDDGHSDNVHEGQVMGTIQVVHPEVIDLPMKKT